MFTSLLLIFFNFVTFWNSKCNESDLHLTVFCVSWTCFGFFCQQKMPPLSEASPSKMGFASRTCCSIQECWPLIAARNCRISFVLSVFPAPDSPLQRQQESRSVKVLLHPCQCPSLCLQRDCCLCASSFSAGRTRPLRMGFQHPKDWL